MKKFVSAAVVAAFAAMTVQAQEIPERQHQPFKPVHKEHMYGRKQLASLNLSEEQKTKLKTQNQEFRKQMEELRKQDNITVKESREKMAALRKSQQEKFQSLLTPEQKAQLEKDRAALKEKGKERMEKRAARMKEELKLTDAQADKLKEQRKATAEKIKAVRENGSLTDEQKKEEVKTILKKQHEDMKSVLTEEQLQQLKERRKDHPRKKKPENS